MPCSQSPARIAVTWRPSSRVHCKLCAEGGLSRGLRAPVRTRYAWGATRPVRFLSRVRSDNAAHTKRGSLAATYTVLSIPPIALEASFRAGTHTRSGLGRRLVRARHRNQGIEDWVIQRIAAS